MTKWACVLYVMQSFSMWYFVIVWIKLLQLVYLVIVADLIFLIYCIIPHFFLIKIGQPQRNYRCQMWTFKEAFRCNRTRIELDWIKRQVSVCHWVTSNREILLEKFVSHYILSILMMPCHCELSNKVRRSSLKWHFPRDARRILVFQYEKGTDIHTTRPYMLIEVSMYLNKTSLLYAFWNDYYFDLFMHVCLHTVLQ